MLSYFVRYRDTIQANLFVPFAQLFVPVLGLENKIQAQAEAAFNARLKTRLEETV